MTYNVKHAYVGLIEIKSKAAEAALMMIKFLLYLC